MVIRYATDVPAAQRTCEVCGSDFYGRADAAYCSAACRQKAYRQRSRTATPVTHREFSGPVPDGDEWMRDRFGDGMRTGYLPLAHRPAAGTGPAKHRAWKENDGLETLRDYVQGITCIGRELYDGEAACVTGQDLKTPLGNALPPGIDPATAAGLAADLKAAIPRVVELASLLDRRAQMTPLPMKVPFASHG
jgi:hypothetical protein